MSGTNCKTTGIGPSCEPPEVGDGAKYDCLEQEIRRCKGVLNKCIGDARISPSTTHTFGYIFSGWVVEGASMIAARLASIAACYSSLNCNFRKCYCSDWSCGGFCLPEPGAIGPGKKPPKKENDDEPEDEDPDAGPQLTALSFTSSSYDRLIERVYGTHIVFGNIFWATEPRTAAVRDLVLNRDTGLYEVKLVNHHYIDFALGLCAGEIQDVVRIWADDVLIYSRDYTNAAALHNGVTLNSASFGIDLTRPYNPTYGSLTVHTGSEDQLVSPVMYAQEGEATPAYRGLAYIVFKNYDITSVTSRIPEFRVEVVRNVSAAVPLIEEEVENNTTTTLGSLPTDILYIEPDTNTVQVGGNGSTASGGRPGLRVLTYSTLEQVRDVVPGQTLTSSNTYDLKCFVPYNDKFFVIQPTPDFNQRPTIYARNSAPAEMATFGIAAGADNHATTRVANLERSPYASHIGTMRTSVAVTELVMAACSGPDVGFYTINIATGQMLNLALFNDLTTGDIVRSVRWKEYTQLTTAVPRINDYLAVFAMHYGRHEIDVRRFNLYQSDTTPYFDDAVAPTRYTIPATAWGSRVSGAVLKDVIRIETLGSFLFHVATAGVNYMFLWNPTAGVVWSSTVAALPIAMSAGPRMYNYPTDNYVWIGSDNILYAIELASGNVQALTTTTPLNCVGAQYYNPHEASVTYISSGTEVSKYFMTHKRVAPQNLDDVIEDILLTAGLQPEEIDVSDLASTAIDGYKLNTATGTSSVLKQLGVLFGLYFYEQGGVLGVARRARGAATALTVDDVGVGDNEAFKFVKEDRYTELMSISLTYNSRAHDYIDQTQNLRKTQFIRGTEFVDNIVNQAYAWPVVMEDTAARIICERLLFEDELVPRVGEVILGPKYAYLSPGDLVAVEYDTNTLVMEVTSVIEDIVGLARKVRLVEIRPELFIENASIEGIVDYSGRYVGDPLERPFVATPILFPVPPPEYQTIGEAGAVNSIMMLGADDSSTFVAKDYYYKTATGFLTLAGTQTKRTLKGALVVKPLPTQSKYSTDRTSEMVIRFDHTDVGAYLASKTKTELLADHTANLLFVGEEIIQFETVTLAGDGVTATFSGLHRGLRSTDDRIDNHNVGELCALYVEGSMVKMQINLRDETDSVIEIGIVTRGSTPDENTLQLMPITYYNRRAPMIPKVLRVGYGDSQRAVAFKATHRTLTYTDLTDDDRVSLTHFNRGLTYIAVLKAPYNETLFKQHVQQIYDMGNQLYDTDLRPPDRTYIARFLQLDFNYDHPIITESTTPYTSAQQTQDGVNAYDGEFHFAVFTLDDSTNGDYRPLNAAVPDGFDFIGRVQGYYYPAGEKAPLLQSFQNGWGDHAIPVLES